MIDFNSLKDIINKNHSFILTTHINPDGDAIGSELALAGLLELLNKKYQIINYSPTPHYLEFLDINKIIIQYSPEYDTLIKNADVLIALDFNQPDRLKKMKNAFTSSNAIKICIDHHRNPSDFANFYFVDPDYNATGEIIYELILSFGKEYFNKFIADAIYAAIMTDTGSFRFQRMTSKIHRMAAELLDLGTDPTEIYNKIYNEINFEKLRLLGLSIANIKSRFDNKISYMIVTQKMLEEADATEEDIEGFVNHTLSITGTLIGLLFLELKDGLKVSLRSKGNLPVNELAEIFGGGGHINAAGIRLYDKNYETKIEEILKVSEDFISKHFNL